MPSPSSPHAPDIPAELPGDAARRRAKRSLLTFIIALPISWWLFSRLEPIWDRILPLEGLPFMAAATLLGAVLAIAPLVAAIGFLLAVWFGVDSVYLPRRTTSAALDKPIVAVGLLVWFSPALAAIAAPGAACMRAASISCAHRATTSSPPIRSPSGRVWVSG
ncbi:hypothetical protein [Thauera sp. SDU_THAU2]|uniref:hypothetical protein n=1 Tax=Thauera sp. SDU_THAU2 TaxID=3136633 RepID=UPI00311F00D4